MPCGGAGRVQGRVAVINDWMTCLPCAYRTDQSVCEFLFSSPLPSPPYFLFFTCFQFSLFLCVFSLFFSNPNFSYIFQATLLLARPSLLGWRPWLVGWRPLLSGCTAKCLAPCIARTHTHSCLSSFSLMCWILKSSK